MAGYIGTAPVPHATQHREVFTSTAGQTVFTTAGYTPEFLDVYINGIKIQNVVDFAATDGSSIVLTAAASLSDVIEVTTFSSFDTANQDFSVGTTTVDILVVNGTVDGRDVAADGVIIDSLGTAATTASTDYATAAQGTLAASALQPADALDATKLTGALPAISGASLTGINTEPFKAVAVTGATPSLNVGTYNFFDHGSLAADATVSFASVPTNANWRYSYINNFISNSYDLTTGLYSGQALESVGNQDSDPGGLAFKPDGTKMYITGFQNDSIYEYDLSKAWDVSTAVYLQLFSGFGLQTTRPEGIFFKPDGLVLYMVGSMNPDSVYSYNLSTAWNVTTAVYNNTLDLSSRETSLRDIHFKSDGTAFYVLGSTSDRVEEYTMSTAWNVATGTYSGQSHYVGGVDGSPNGLFINPTGTELFVCGAGGDRVYQYTLSTAFLFSSATLTKRFDVTSQSTEPQAVTFDPDGYSMFLLSNVPTAVHSYQVGVGAAITLPSSVVGSRTKAGNGDRVTYEFFTLDGGTTVNLISEEKV